jgi:hypothetical protein
MTPLVLRRKVSPLTGWLRNRFSRRPQPVVAPVETADEGSATPVIKALAIWSKCLRRSLELRRLPM